MRTRRGSLAIVALLLAGSITQAQFGKSLPILPNPKITPGDVLPVTADDICVPGYAKKVRNVPKEVKDQAYANYGIKSHKAGDFEVDHLISLELGGSNSIRNLWPQSFKTKPWNAHVKDKLENELHSRVCAGTIDLPTAQREIAANWIKAYQKYVGTGKSSRRSRRQAMTNAPTRRVISFRRSTRRLAAGEKVWVNTRSGVYWLPGTEYYGKTTAGRYLSEADALRLGYHAARGRGLLARAGK